ncbi:MAG: methylmalonyl-CoA mutase family protein [Bryobacterales bacterium]|nr:methylmalonyl-CoA mutase family protein [Bryobacterales bacterium]
MSDLKSTETNLRNEFPPVSDEAWRAAVEADLKGAEFDKKLVWRTYEGIAVEPYYRQGALEDLGYLESAPGQSPWHRGPSAIGNSWTILQEILTLDPAAANKAARQALDGGASGICFVTEACPAGVRGVNLQSLEQMRTLIRDLPLYKTGFHFRAGENALPVLANFLAALSASKADSRDIYGSVDYDPLSVLATQGEISGSRDEVFFELSSVLEAAQSRMPGFKVLSIQAAPLLEAGGSAVQEIAFTLAAIVQYLSAFRSHGQDPARVLPHMQITFAVSSTYFMEIAKLRAVRLLVSRVIQAFLGEGHSVPHICIVARTADFNKSIYDPHTNLLRATTEAMAAAIGGADAILVSPFDKTFRAPDERSLRLSRNIQLLLKHEAYLDKVADPAAGSYLFENLTNSLCAAAWTLFQKVEEMGGYLAAASNGFLKDEIGRVAGARQLAIASRRQVLLGVNQYPNIKEKALPQVECDSLVSEYTGIQKPFKLASDSVLDSMVAAFAEGSCLSDAREALRQRERLLAQPIEIHRAAEAFERIRLRTEQFERKTGAIPTVFLFKMGNVAMRQARASFVMNLFGCAGFDVKDNLGFASVDEAVAAAVEAKSDLVVLCSSDEEYVELAREACPRLRAAIHNVKIIVAGFPKEHMDTLKELGVDEFVHVRTVAQDALSYWQQQLGMGEAKN